MDERIEAAREAVLAAGELVRESFDGQDGIDVEEKDRNDYVTGTDRASEELIVSMLTAAFPDIPVMGEEGGGSVGEKLFWVIDPLDGTTNFIHGYPQVGGGKEPSATAGPCQSRTPILSKNAVSERDSPSALSNTSIHTSIRSGSSFSTAGG